jgi:hypothetical protein
MKRLKILVAIAALLLASGGCTYDPSILSGGRGKVVKDQPPSAGREPVKLHGHIDLIAKDRAGRIKTERHIHNLVTNAGAAGVASRINGSGGEAAFTWIAIGTGVTAANVADTTCQTEISTNGGARANGSATRVTTDVTNDTAQVEVTYNFTGSFAVTESCLLNASSAGTLGARQVFSAINVANGDSLLIRWKVDVD